MTQGPKKKRYEAMNTPSHYMNRRHFLAVGVAGIALSSRAHASQLASPREGPSLKADNGPWAQARDAVRSGALGDIRHLQGGASNFDLLHPVMCGFLYAIGPALPISVMALGEIAGAEGYLMSAAYAGGHRIVLVCGETFWKGGPQIIRGTKGALQVLGDGVRFVENTTVGHGHKNGMKLWSGSADEFSEDVNRSAALAMGMGLEARRIGKTVYLDDEVAAK